MAKANAQVEVSAGTSRLASGLRVAANYFTAFGSSIARGIGGALKRINFKPGDMMKNAVSHAGGDLIGKGLGAITDAAGEVRDFNRDLVRFQIATDGASGSSKDVQAIMMAASKATGIARSEVLAGAQAYVGFTGDVKGAAAAAEVFARVAAASGASTKDVAQAQSALKTSMGITADQAEAAFSGLIVQGKGGAVEITNMASELAALAPRFALFKGGKGLSGLRELGAGFQVVMKNSSTAADAATKYRAMMESLGDTKTLKELKKFGVQVVDNKGKLLDASTIFHNIAASKKLFEKGNLAKAFGRSESQMAVLAMREHIGTYDELRKAAEDTGAVQRDMNTFLESDAGRLDKAFNDMKLAIADAFTPERIKGFTNAVIDLVDKLGPVIDLVGKAGDLLGGIAGVGKNIRGYLSGNENANPFKTGGKGVAGQIFDMNDPDKGRKANAVGYDRAVGDILAGEINERTSPESIKRAVFARYSANAGEATAGNRYLANALPGGGEQVAATVDKVVKEAMTTAGKDFALGLRDALGGLANSIPDLRIGDDQVATAQARSKKSRQRPH